MALVAYERSEWIAGIAAGVSLLLLIAGVSIISSVIGTYFFNLGAN